MKKAIVPKREELKEDIEFTLASDVLKEENLFKCPCGKGGNATFYCDKTNPPCNPDSPYFCLQCDDNHDHKYKKMAQIWDF